MTLNGIDIASHQAGLNCATIPADFIIVKISQGTKYVNPLWDKWAGQILSSGKKLGFYHYASGGDPIAEANYFWAYAKKYAGRAVFFLDWEAGYNNSFAKHYTWCKPWLDRIAQLSGTTPGVYFQSSIHNSFKNCRYPLWIAQYPNYTPTGYLSRPWNEGAYICAIRQYSSVGRLTGYNGNLDLDKFYGDHSTWAHTFNLNKEDIMTADDIREIAEQVWQYKIGDVQARDRLYGIDSIRGPEQNNRQIQIADQVQEIAQNLKTTSQTDISQLTASVKALAQVVIALASK